MTATQIKPKTLPQPETRADYKHFKNISTRWMDNDIYGHVNNVQYYSYFDTAVNRFLIEQGVLDIHQGDVIGLVVETQCRYMDSLSFPETIETGIAVSRIGNSSVRYEIGLFKAGQDKPAAQGHFIHVYVDRENRRPCTLPAPLRNVLKTLELSI